jgi:hypothetical protein
MFVPHRSGATRLRAGDPIRAALVAAAAVTAADRGLHDALALLLVLPPVLVLRRLPAGNWLDAGFCGVLATAQIGAIAGLTERTGWWDAAAHATTGALLALLIARLAPTRSPALGLVVIGALAIAWESVEALSDAVLGTAFAPTAADTWTDLALGMLGAAVTAGLVCMLSGSRGPPTNRFV